MKRHKKLALLMFATVYTIWGLLLPACWVGLPSGGPAGAKKHVDKTFTLKKEILIVEWLITPISWRPGKKDRLGRNQEIIATLEKGSRIKIIGIRSFRTESGVHFGYRCIDLKTDQKFDLVFTMVDCIGIEYYQ